MHRHRRLAPECRHTGTSRARRFPSRASLDLGFGLPVLAWLTLVRPGRLGGWVLLPVVEVGLLVALGMRGRRAVAEYREGRARSSYPVDAARAFPAHRRRAYPAILGALVLATLVETAGLHLLLGLWTPVAAWVATGPSVYGILWMLGDFHALRR